MAAFVSGAPERSVLRTVRAALLIGGGRFIGILWPILLTSKLGIAFYGRFAIAIAASTLIALPLDAYYLVRAPRTSDRDFSRDQASRVWTGVVLAAVGGMGWIFISVAGFAIAKAGFDMMFNARKSSFIRTSRPDRALAEDALRQTISLAVCMVALNVFGTRSLTLVGLCYLVGYLPFLAAALRAVLGTLPRLPERSRVTGFLTLEAVLGVLYMQGDVLLLGWLLSDTQVGYYSLASQAAQTGGMVGQSYAATFHDRLRAQGGAVEAGPPLAHTWLGAGVCGAGMLGAAGVLLAVGAPHDLWLTFLVFAAITATRFCSAVFTTVLALQSRDLYRMALSSLALALKVIAIVALGRTGSPGAALGFLVGELLFVVLPQRTLYPSLKPVAVPA